MEELKASGNAAFKKGDFASAVDFFTRAIDAATLENHHVLYSNRSAARVRCCCRQKSSSLSFRFYGESVFFWSSSSSLKSLIVLVCVEERVDRNVCRGSVVSVGLDAFRGDTNLLSVRGGGGGGAREEEEEEEEESYFSKG